MQCGYIYRKQQLIDNVIITVKLSKKFKREAKSRNYFPVFITNFLAKCQNLNIEIIDLKTSLTNIVLVCNIFSAKVI